DFAVKGPSIEQWRVTSPEDASATETFIRSGSCLFADFAGGLFTTAAVSGKGRVWATQLRTGRLQVSLAAGSHADLDLGAWNAKWSGEAVALFEADETGQLVRRLPKSTRDTLTLAAADDGPGNYVILLGNEARKPDISLSDLRIAVGGVSVDPNVAPPVDATLDVSVTVSNGGLSPADALAVVLHLDSVAGPVLLRRMIERLAPGATAEVHAALAAASADGARRIVAVIQAEKPVSQCGRLRLETAFVGPFREAAFPHRWPIEVSVPGGAAEGLPFERPFKLDDVADAENLRVKFANGVAVPGQFEPAGAEEGHGTLVFVLPAGLPVGPQEATVLAPPRGSDAVRPHTARFEVAENGERLVFDTYSARLTNGVLGDVSVRSANGDEMRVASQIIVSSKETGWSREEGETEGVKRLHSGPVRAVFSCTKLVSERFHLTREWRFYGDRFEVLSSCNPGTGCLTRAFYTEDATATNETGRTVAMDGAGDGEDFGFKGTPQWYALHSDRWNSACIALSRSGGFTYWDSGTNLGQISLNHTGDGTEKRVYIWGAGAENDGFAREAAAAYADVAAGGE
ncbi:MAG: hypothetical protein HON70_10475, partial [Lentisphaerae bacterium]|nr:hypothetical protein [Lentisphaerota bacterium]